MKRAKVGRVPTFSFTKDGHDLTVVGMRGHILNLDYPDEFNDWGNTDLKRLVWVEPVKKVTEPAFADALTELGRGVDEVVVATDFDREGELIGKEALEVIRAVNPNVAVRRARYSSLTRAEIEESFSNLVDFDLPLAESAESRQVVDLAWGAALTRFVSIAPYTRVDHDDEGREPNRSGSDGADPDHSGDADAGGDEQGKAKATDR